MELNKIKLEYQLQLNCLQNLGKNKCKTLMKLNLLKTQMKDKKWVKALKSHNRKTLQINKISTTLNQIPNKWIIKPTNNRNILVIQIFIVQTRVVKLKTPIINKILIKAKPNKITVNKIVTNLKTTKTHSILKINTVINSITNKLH